jgi:hypothetical protein
VQCHRTSHLKCTARWRPISHRCDPVDQRRTLVLLAPGLPGDFDSSDWWPPLWDRSHPRRLHRTGRVPRWPHCGTPSASASTTGRGKRGVDRSELEKLVRHANREPEHQFDPAKRSRPSDLHRRTVEGHQVCGLFRALGTSRRPGAATRNLNRRDLLASISSPGPNACDEGPFAPRRSSGEVSCPDPVAESPGSSSEGTTCRTPRGRRWPNRSWLRRRSRIRPSPRHLCTCRPRRPRH